MSKAGNCASCTFFDEQKADIGVCRFNPPVTQPAPDAQGLWPVVKESDWCGHFEKDAA